MKITDVLSSHHKNQVISIWNNVYPKSLIYKSRSDFDQYLQKLEDKKHYIYCDENNKILAWSMSFIRKNERWFAIIISNLHQGQGLGSKLIEQLKSDNATLNGWVIESDLLERANGELYRSPVSFYAKLGFTLHLDCRIENEKMTGFKINWTRD